MSMLVNTDVTVYSFCENTPIRLLDGIPTINGAMLTFGDRGYQRRYFEKAYWNESAEMKVSKSGITFNDSTTILLYDNSELLFTSGKDLIVKGNCNFEFDNSSEQTISESFRNFKRLYDYLSIQKVANLLFGGLPHIEVTAK